jgi:hypothetical protein
MLCSIILARSLPSSNFLAIELQNFQLRFNDRSLDWPYISERRLDDYVDLSFAELTIIVILGLFSLRVSLPSNIPNQSNLRVALATIESLHYPTRSLVLSKLGHCG